MVRFVVAMCMLSAAHVNCFSNSSAVQFGNSEAAEFVNFRTSTRACPSVPTFISLRAVTRTQALFQLVLKDKYKLKSRDLSAMISFCAYLVLSTMFSYGTGTQFLHVLRKQLLFLGNMRSASVLLVAIMWASYFRPKNMDCNSDVGATVMGSAGGLAVPVAVFLFHVMGYDKVGTRWEVVGIVLMTLGTWLNLSTEFDKDDFSKASGKGSKLLDCVGSAAINEVLAPCLVYIGLRCYSDNRRLDQECPDGTQIYSQLREIGTSVFTTVSDLVNGANLANKITPIFGAWQIFPFFVGVVITLGSRTPVIAWMQECHGPLVASAINEITAPVGWAIDAFWQSKMPMFSRVYALCITVMGVSIDGIRQWADAR